MRIGRRIGTWAGVGGMMLVLGGVGWSQQTGGDGGGHGSTPATSPSSVPVLPPIGPDIGIPSQMEVDQAKMRNADRQKQLVLDTKKLVALADELQVDVDKSNKDTLSLDVIRKADEIEKLARSVKEKMKGM